MYFFLSLASPKSKKIETRQFFQDIKFCENPEGVRLGWCRSFTSNDNNSNGQISGLRLFCTTYTRCLRSLVAAGILCRSVAPICWRLQQKDRPYGTRHIVLTRQYIKSYVLGHEVSFDPVCPRILKPGSNNSNFKNCRSFDLFPHF